MVLEFLSSLKLNISSMMHQKEIQDEMSIRHSYLTVIFVFVTTMTSR